MANHHLRRVSVLALLMLLAPTLQARPAEAPPPPTSPLAMLTGGLLKDFVGHAFRLVLIGSAPAAEEEDQQQRQSFPKEADLRENLIDYGQKDTPVMVERTFPEQRQPEMVLLPPSLSRAARAPALAPLSLAQGGELRDKNVHRYLHSALQGYHEDYY